MKKVLSSKGIFEITNSLYESIKKNNPELLMEDDPSLNLFVSATKEDIKKEFKETIKSLVSEKLNHTESEFDNWFNEWWENPDKKLKNWFEEYWRGSNDKKEEIWSEIGEELKRKFPDSSSNNTNSSSNNTNSSSNNTNSSSNNPFNVNSSSQRNIGSGENDTPENQISEDIYKKRLDILFKNQITNKSINFIVNNLKNNTNNGKKKKCIEKIEEKLGKIKNDGTNKSENRLIYVILAIFLNISTNVNDTSNEYNFNNLYEKAINEKNNIIYLMSEEEWNYFDGTLVLKNINVDEENQESNNKNIKNQITDEFKKIKDYSFNSEIPKVIIDYYKAIYKNLFGKVSRTGFPKTFKDIKNTNDSESDKFWEKAGKIVQGILPGAVEFTPFRTLRGWGPKSAYFAKYLAYLYVNFLKKYSMEKFHEQLTYKGINLIEFYKNIQPTFYLRNACMINCRTQKATNLVISTIDKLRIERSDVNVRKEVLATGLNTTNIVYLIYTNDETDNLSVNKEEDMLLKKIKNAYFIIVTEGFVRKGELLKKTFNKSKDLLSTKGNKLFGMDMNVSSSGK